ncbi:uncharacterized protein LY89DRAFT_671959 [Mollisia scopiformis]|uniref:Uncharacterized protein n=1 Tax=Mollisia scopiformis TaxID=149040 RepID=A0A194X0D6_MOLSC|nr:uncharacterized protein LY89DRAFT_671959 [Mollisia scopiformis]KUJ13661.1 hypothetical protein LY89DRAFT_671959 [Mollisia scopiformis]
MATHSPEDSSDDEKLTAELEQSTSIHSNDFPEVFVTVRELSSDECSDIIVTPNPAGSTSLIISIEPPPDGGEEESKPPEANGWVSLPFLVRGIEDPKERVDLFEVWRYMITSDVTSEVKSRQDQIWRMEMEEKLEWMAIEDRSLSDMLDLVLAMESNVSARDALILVFEAIARVDKDELDWMNRQQVEAEIEEDNSREIHETSGVDSAGEEAFPVQETDDDVFQASLEKEIHEAVLSLERVASIASDIVEEEKLEVKNLSSSDERREGSDNLRIQLMVKIYQQETGKLADVEEQDDAAETKVGNPVEATPQQNLHESHAVESPNDLTDTSLREVDKARINDDAPESVQDAVTRSLNEVLELGNSDDKSIHIIHKDGGHAKETRPHIQNDSNENIKGDSPDNEKAEFDICDTIDEGGSEKPFDPDETLEELDSDEGENTTHVDTKYTLSEHIEVIPPDEKAMSTAIEQETDGPSHPIGEEDVESAMKPEELDELLDELLVEDKEACRGEIGESVATVHVQCDETCQAFMSLLSTMEELDLPPDKFCGLLAQVFPTVAESRAHESTEVLSKLGKSPAKGCLLKEETKESTKILIQNFTQSLEDLYEQVKAGLEERHSKRSPSADYEETTGSFFTGLSSLLKFGKLILQKEGSGETGVETIRSDLNSNQEVDNQNDKPSTKKKKPNNRKRKKKARNQSETSRLPAGLETLLKTPDQTSTIPESQTVHKKLIPLGRPIHSDESFGYKLFRGTLNKLVHRQLPVIIGHEAKVTRATYQRAATRAQSVLTELDHELGVESDEKKRHHGKFWELLDHHVYSKVYEELLAGSVFVNMDNENWPNTDAGIKKEPKDIFLEEKKSLLTIGGLLETSLELLCLSEPLGEYGGTKSHLNDWIDQYITPLRKEIEDVLCRLTMKMWLYGDEYWAFVLNKDGGNEFLADIARLPEIFKKAQNMTISALKEAWRQHAATNNFDIATNTFKFPISTLVQIRTIAIVRGLQSKVTDELEKKLSDHDALEEEEELTVFDIASYLKIAFPGEKWTYAMVRPCGLSDMFRATRVSSGQDQYNSCIIKWAPPCVPGLGTAGPAPHIRQDIETFALETFGSFPLKESETDEPWVAVPRLIKRSRKNSVLIMHDVGEFTTLWEVFTTMDTQHFQNLQFVIVGARLGMWFASLHATPLSRAKFYKVGANTKHSELTDLVRKHKVVPIEGYLQALGISDSQELGKRIVDDFDRELGGDFMVFAVGDASLETVLAGKLFGAFPRLAILDWDFSGPGRGINGDMAQLLAGVQSFWLSQIRMIEDVILARAMKEFTVGLLEYVDSMRKKGSTLVMVKSAQPEDYGPKKRRLPPKVATVLRSAFIAHGKELICLAWGYGYRCICCGVDKRESCEVRKRIVEHAAWFLRMAGRNENEFQGQNWKQICSNPQAKLLLNLVFSTV